ncbi:hypothetical protein MMC10_000614 [Thelotrema lepadinum]|nr:hypothetical protein [Thelotrema lepadinum]
MRLQFSLLTLLSTLTFSLAQTPNPSGSNSFNNPPQGYLLHAGQSSTFTWSNLAGSTVTLNLRSGANGNLDDGQIIASNLANSGTFTWNVPNDIVQGNSYTLEIIDEQDTGTVNYTPPFNILSNVLASSSPAPSSTAAPSTSAPPSSTAAPSTTAAPSSSSAAVSSSMASQMSTASVMSTMSTAASGSASSASAASTASSGSSGATSTSAAPASTSSSGAAANVAFGAGAGVLAVAAGFAGLL